MPIGQQDGGGVPMTPAVAARGIHELFDLPLGQIFARAGRAADLSLAGAATVTFNAVGACVSGCKLSMEIHLCAYRTVTIRTRLLQYIPEAAQLT